MSGKGAGVTGMTATDSLDKFSHISIAQFAPFILPEGSISLCAPLDREAVFRVENASALFLYAVTSVHRIRHTGVLYSLHGLDGSFGARQHCGQSCLAWRN